MGPVRGAGSLPRVSRRVLTVALVVLAAVAGAIGLAAFFNSRDEATFSGEAGPGRAYPDRGDRHLRPGERPPEYSSEPPTSGAHRPVPLRREERSLTDDQLLHALEQGNVVLAYRDAALEAPLRTFAREVAGPFSAELAAAGQAVVLHRDPRIGPGVTAVAWRHLQPATGADDPRLREFVEFWLGRGSAAG